MTDTELLNWVQEQGFNVVNDDGGRWACVLTGFQNVPDVEEAKFIQTTFDIEASEWRPTIREAIQAAYDDMQKGMAEMEKERMTRDNDG